MVIRVLINKFPYYKCDSIKPAPLPPASNNLINYPLYLFKYLFSSNTESNAKTKPNKAKGNKNL